MPLLLAVLLLDTERERVGEVLPEGLRDCEGEGVKLAVTLGDPDTLPERVLLPARVADPLRVAEPHREAVAEAEGLRDPLGLGEGERERDTVTVLLVEGVRAAEAVEVVLARAEAVAGSAGAGSSASERKTPWETMPSREGRKIRPSKRQKRRRPMVGHRGLKKNEGGSG